MGKYKGLQSPVIKPVKNPLKRKSSGNLKAEHTRQLKQAGVKPPKSPV